MHTRRQTELRAPRAAQREKTRGEILEAAKRVIARQGFARATSRHVAAEAGVSVGTVFLHFADVAALAEALLDEHIAEALAEAHRTMPSGETFVRQLVHLAITLYESYDLEPDLSREFLAASLFRSEPTGPSTRRMAELAAWFSRTLARTSPAPSLDVNTAFAAFFALYFATLVGGLRGALTRAQQRAFLETTLGQLFENAPRTGAER